MKRSILCCLLLCVLSGCQSIQSGVKVELEGCDKFPSEIVGTWQSVNSDWQITFKKDGTISSIHHAWGGVEIIPGKVNHRKGRYDGDIVFEPGVWSVFYSKNDNTLTVEILLEHFEIEMKGGVLKGNQKDVFVGEVNGDQWEAEWINLPKYTAYTPEPHDLPVDIENNVKDKLIFKKQESEDLASN